MRRIANWNFDKKMQFFVTFLICFLSLFIFLFTTCSYSIFMIRQSKAMAEEQLSLLAVNYETTLDSYKSMATALILDDTIQKYVSMDLSDGNEYYKSTVDTQNTLMNVTNMFSNMNFIAVVSYCTGGYLYKGDSTQLYTRFSEVYRSDYETSGYGTIGGSLRISYNSSYFPSGKRSLNVYLPIYSLTIINEEMGLLCISYNDNFLQSFSDISYLDAGSELMIVDSEGAVLSCAGEKDRGSHFPWMEKLVNSKGGFAKNGMLYSYQKVGKWNFYLVNGVPIEDFYLSILRMLPILIVAVLVMILVSLVIGRRLIRRLYHPLDYLVGEMNRVAEGRLDVRICGENTGEDFQKLAKGFNYMMDEIDALMHRVQQEQIQKERIRFNALQSQIQPHFLYNTLECIHWQAEVEGSREISTMVSALAQYYRICLSRGRDIIELWEELEHVRNYLIIQNMRYDNIIEYEMKIPQLYWNVKIPKLTLQPLIENAIYHGIKCKEGCKGKIEVNVQKEENTLILTVSDNGCGMTEEKIRLMNEKISSFQNDGYGVQNVNKRIELLFGSQYGLRYRSNESRGITVEIYLPLSDDSQQNSGKHTTE